MDLYTRGLIKATQAQATANAAAPKAAGAPRPPAGFTAIPHSRMGGYHRQQGGRWVYWYPGQGIVKEEHPQDQRASDAQRQAADAMDRLHGQVSQRVDHGAAAQQMQQIQAAYPGGPLTMPDRLQQQYRALSAMVASGPQQAAAEPSKKKPARAAAPDKAKPAKAKSAHKVDGRKLSAAITAATKGRVARQPSKDLDEVYSMAAASSLELEDLVYGAASATNGEPSFPPSKLSGFVSDAGFKLAVSIAGEVCKAAGSRFKVDEDKQAIKVYDPRAAKEVSKRLHDQAPPPPNEHQNDHGLKGIVRAKEKLLTYLDESGNPDPSRLVDVIRAGLRFETVDDVYRALDHVNQKSKIVRMKDRFESPVDGYRDILLNLEMPNGHVCELQIHLGAILDVKNGTGHKLYEQSRVIAELATSEKRNLTTAEFDKMASLQEVQKKLYDEAFANAKVSRT